MATHNKKLPEQEVNDPYSRPEEFATFAATFEFAKKAVYSITRIREVGGITQISTIGTGFLVGPNKLLTCAHVINHDQLSKAVAPLAHHEDGDTYYLLNKDCLDKAHFYRFVGKLGKNVDVYDTVDAAILTLGDDFYQIQGKIIQHKDVYLKLAAVPYGIGAEAGILGFPAESDDAKQVKGLYEDSATGELNDDLIIKRVDRGIVNARYIDPTDKLVKYDFTMAFNPGNSGGPIIDEQGNVIAVVRGYKSFPIHVIEEKFIQTDPTSGAQTIFSLPATIRATYSIGYSAENLGGVISAHKLPQ